MRIEIRKGAKARGSIMVPPSKSVAHRALICASLAKGESTIRNIPDCDDVNATIECLMRLGVKMEHHGGYINVQGTDILHATPTGVLPCGESATTLRFLVPIAVLTGKEVQFTGEGRLLSRPMDEYEKLFNMKIENNIATVSGKIRNVYEVGGEISSQFCGGLMMAIGRTGGEIIIPTQETSRPYNDMTMYVMRQFGVITIRGFRNNFRVDAGGYKPANVYVGGDWSAAAVFGLLNMFGSSVNIDGMDDKFTIGDAKYPELYKKVMKGEEVDISDNPDLGPLLFCLAAVKGEGRFSCAERLRYKESDRIASMQAELAKFNIRMEDDNGFVTVRGQLTKPTEVLDSHADHRIAMALSVLLTLTGGEIDGAEAVSKSFPDFFDALSRAGIGVIRR